MSTTSLWGALPPVTAAQPTPLSILREQAELLTATYNGMLEGEVETITLPNKLRGKLSIVAPALGRYRLPVIEVTYDLMGYGFGIVVHNLVEETQQSCQNIEKYKELLANYLSSTRIHSTIEQLLLQSAV